MLIAGRSMPALWDDVQSDESAAYLGRRLGLGCRLDLNRRLGLSRGLGGDRHRPGGAPRPLPLLPYIAPQPRHGLQLSHQVLGAQRPGLQHLRVCKGSLKDKDGARLAPRQQHQALGTRDKQQVSVVAQNQWKGTVLKEVYEQTRLSPYAAAEPP